jgi:predicted nucleic acid-binding Zn ribbon protein
VPAEGDHRHCKACGRVCAVDEETCSKACREKRATALASRRRYSYILYAAILLLVIAAASSYLH